MKQSKKLMALPLFYALMLTACNNNNSIPSSYIGFKNMNVRKLPINKFDV